MEIKILAFGQIAELVGNSEFLVSDLESTDALKAWLANNYPAIQNIAFAISVDKKKVVENTSLSQHSVVALLPPFSGG
jgi:molybdopterin converting factor small subunit